MDAYAVLAQDVERCIGPPASREAEWGAAPLRVKTIAAMEKTRRPMAAGSFFAFVTSVLRACRAGRTMLPECVPGGQGTCGVAVATL